MSREALDLFSAACLGRRSPAWGLFFYAGTLQMYVEFVKYVVYDVNDF